MPQLWAPRRLLQAGGWRGRRAQRIRDLVNVARDCIIEIGRELIAAKGTPHGTWLPSTEREFGWSRQTASNFMRVTEAFGDKLPRLGKLPSLSIEATA